MTERYNDDPQASTDASKALLLRGRELLEGALVDEVWGNMGFHVAAIRLQNSGVSIPHGSDAQSYIALVLATYQHILAGRKMEDALQESPS